VVGVLFSFTDVRQPVKEKGYRGVPARLNPFTVKEKVFTKIVKIFVLKINNAIFATENERNDKNF